MAIYRGTGGSGNSTDDSIVSAVTEQAGIATTKAGEAATSASNANTSATNAATSATTASTKATEANTAKNLAENARDSAQTYSDTALQAASTAGSHANAAETSAQTANNSSVQTVAGISTEVQNVNNIRTEIQNVDTIKTDVTTVAGISSNVTTVAADASDIGTVATNIANVNNVGDNIANVNAVHSNASNINTVAADASDIGTVSSNISNVNTVAGISSDVTTVAGLESKMDTVIADASDIGAVANNIGDVTTVAGINSEVDTVAGISAKVTTVADNITDVQNADTNAANASASASQAANSASAAGASATTASTKATEASNSATAASNSATTATTKATEAAGSATTATTKATEASTSATNAATSATTATTKASEAASSATAASGSATTATTKASEADASATSAASSATDSSNAASTWSSFYNSYLGTYSSAPSVDVQGNPIVTGAFYYDTGTGSNTVGLYVYNGSSWIYSTNYNNVTAPYTLAQDLNADGNNITAVGSLGIGTTSPARKLTVQGGSGDNLPARIIGGSSTTKSHIEFQDASTTADYKVTLGSVGDGMSFQAGGSERMRIDSSGHVGIGTTSPSMVGGTRTLHINGNAGGGGIRLSQGSVNSGSILYTYPQGISLETSNRTRMRISANLGDVSFYEDSGTEPKFYWDASAESLGIGTTTPAQKLDVSSAGTTRIQVKNTNLTSSGLYIAEDSTGAQINEIGAYPLRFNTNGTERMRIDSSGKVGIGTSSPENPLHISALTEPYIRIENTNTILTEGQIVSGLIFEQNDASGGGAGITGRIQMRSADRPDNGTYFGNVADMDFLVSGSSSGGASDNASKTAMTLRAGTGNVGIGTPSPEKNLHLAGDNPQYVLLHSTANSNTAGDVSGGLLFMNGDDSLPAGDRITAALKATVEDEFGRQALTFSTNTTNPKTSYGQAVDYTDNTIERMRIDSSGNVGIGTTSPTNTLSIKGSVNQLDIETTTAGVTLESIDRSDLNAQSDLSYYARHGAHKFFGSSYAERMRIDSSGNVGIGTSSPSAKLHTVGANTNATNLATSATNAKVRIQNNSASSLSSYQGYTGNSWYTQVANGNGTTSYDLSLNPYGGNVGIGTASPAALLDLKDTAPKIRLTDERSITWTGGETLGELEFYTTDASSPNGTKTASFIKSINTSSSTVPSAELVFGVSQGAGASANATEAMRIDSSGNLLVGTTNTTPAQQSTVTGISLRNTGAIETAANQGNAARFNRLGNDGSIIEFRKDGSTVGSISVSAGEFYIAHDGATNTGLRFRGNGTIIPVNPNGNGADASQDLGASLYRFKDLYRSGSTYSTSDRNKKQDIRDLTDAEARVAVVAKGSLKAFRYIDTVEAEGDDANIHFGIIAQDLKAAFEAEGLNPNNYQVFKTTTYTDDDGVEQTTYSVCYENLLAFIISAI